MKIALMETPGNIKIKEVEKPKPKDDELLVQIKHVGICGSDIHYYEHGKIGDFVVEKPIILGHESAGVVVDMGKNVKNFEIGDSVTIEPGYTCGKCEYCLSGRYNLCPDVIFMATPPYDGAFSEYVAYPAYMVFKLPKNMSTLEGALIEPLAVGIYSTDLGEAKLGQSAVILGSGAIGLCTLMSLKAKGINEIYVVDVLENRLNKAKELGATKTINAKDEDPIKVVMDFTNGEGVDMVYEAAGHPTTILQTSKFVKKGGVVVLIGMSANSVVPYDFGTLMGKEASIKTVFRYRNIYPKAIKSVADGIIPISKIVTNTFKMDEIPFAMDYSVKNKSDIVKAVIEM